MILDQIDSHVHANGSMEVTFRNIETGEITTEIIDNFYDDDDFNDDDIPPDVLAEIRAEWD